MKKGFRYGGDGIKVTGSEVYIESGGEKITVRRGSDGSKNVIIDTGSHLDLIDYVSIAIGSGMLALAVVVGSYACSRSYSSPAQSVNASIKSPLEDKVAQNTGAMAGGVESRLGLMGNAGQSYESSQMSR